MRRMIWGAIAALLWWTPAQAQQANGFVFNAATSLAVTTSSTNVALPGSGQRVLLQNTGASTAFLAFGASGVVATASGMPMVPNACIFMTVTSWTNIAAITSTGTANILITQGEGSPPLACGTAPPAAGAAGFPAGATATAGNAVGSTASITATLAAVANKTNYLCGFTYQGSNPTAAANVVIAFTGIGNLTAGLAYPTGAIATPAIPQPPPYTVTFSPCLPATATNTAITVQSSALGAGAPIASIAAWGYVF